MPIYEYRCAACGFQKEYLQKMSDAPLTDCPECGKASLGKMVTAAGFHLKGSGWYVTDFKQGREAEGRRRRQVRCEGRSQTRGHRGRGRGRQQAGRGHGGEKKREFVDC